MLASASNILFTSSILKLVDGLTSNVRLHFSITDHVSFVIADHDEMPYDEVPNPKVRAKFKQENYIVKKVGRLVYSTGLLIFTEYLFQYTNDTNTLHFQHSHS